MRMSRALEMAARCDAGHWAVRISTSALMFCVRAGFVVGALGVAIDARSVGVSDLVDVAITANRAVVRQAPEGVIVSDTQPSGGVVAAGARAIGREIRGHVVGDSAAQREGTLPSSDVAAVAVGRQRAGIIIVHVAGGACGGEVSAGQRERRSAVVKHAGSPGGDGMAGSALIGGGRETSGAVVGNIAPDGGSALESGSVAAVAIRGVQGVITIDMAGSTGSSQVRSY
jgi:hypothetical protein